MNNYIRRTAKFILYLAVIFFIVLFIVPKISGGKAPKITLTDILRNQRMVLFLGLILSYTLVYPLVAFVNLKRHLNGTFEDNRTVIEKAFEILNYIKILDTPDKIIYRRKSQFSRFIQWYEDGITIFPHENPVVFSGMRKPVKQVDRLIDQLLIRAGE